ncbi:MAG: response regulator [Pseudomonadales bacterium]|nr:response regulator [Pseudomonadales bacterium]
MKNEQLVNLSHCRILVVDDKPLNVALLVKILISEAVNISVANDGPAAINVAAEAQPDLILLDVQMPGMDGFEVCRALKQQPSTRDIPAVSYTHLTLPTKLEV